MISQLFSSGRSNSYMASGLVKGWLLIASAMLGLNLFIILTLVQTAPQLRVVAQVLPQDMMTSLQMAEAAALESDVGDKKLIEEMLVRFYLTQRYTFFPDELEMTQRWGGNGAISILSTPSVYQKYQEDIKPLREVIKSTTKTTYVDVRSLSRQDNTFTVDFDLYTMEKGLPTQRKSRTAVIRFQNIAGRRLLSANAYNRLGFTNPYGFTVTSYNESEKKQVR